jgi:5-methyltetrahydropteroyltriglutamate--homocysteine methyltransferase
MMTTTHVGSLPRSPVMLDVLRRQEGGERVSGAEFETALQHAVNDVVARQLELGITVVSDGEQSKASYATYVRHRLSGFAEAESEPFVPADIRAFPSFLAQSRFAAAPRRSRPCVGHVAYVDRAPLERDLQTFRAALGAATGFLAAPSPGTVAFFHPNLFYPSEAEYLEAVGEALRLEYEAIVGAGFILQIDAPDLAFARHLGDEAAARRRSRLSVEALNHALRDVAASSCRVHLCWGNYEGPHHLDVPLARILPDLLRLKPAGLSFEAANPRHAHEWQVWQGVSVPPEKVLLPGVIDTTTNFIEHPELVAQRLRPYIELVGVERVIASTDCGFSTFAAFPTVDPAIAWSKLASLVEGAAIAAQIA